MSDAGVSLEPVVTEADIKAAAAMWKEHGPWKLGTMGSVAISLAAHRQAAVAAERARIVALAREQADAQEKLADRGLAVWPYDLRRFAAAIEGTDLESPCHG